MQSREMAEPIEVSSLYSGTPLFSFAFGVGLQCNIGDFHVMSSLETVDSIIPGFSVSSILPRN